MRMVTRQVLGALLLSGCVGFVGAKSDFDAGLGGPEPTGFAGAAGGSSGGGAGGGPGAGSGGTGPGAGPGGSTGQGVSTDTVSTTGLPCEVLALVQTRC